MDLTDAQRTRPTMKIVYVNTLYHPLHEGGAEKSVQLLAEAMAVLGHEVHVVTLSDGGVEDSYTHNGVLVHRFPLRNIYWPDASVSRSPMKRLSWHLRDMFNVRSRADVASVLEEVAPDIVHTNGLSGFSVSVWDAARRASVPVVHSARDYYLIHPNAKLFARGSIQRADSLACKVWSIFKRYKSAHVAGFISISNYVKDLHLDEGFFSRAQATTIYNPVQIPSALVRKTTGPWTYGFLGRLDESKGLELLLDAFNKTSAGQCRLLIAGKGDPGYEAKIKQAAGDDVAFLGHVKPEDFFPTIDCLVVPSLWAEPLGRVVLEAYAHGVPVIGSRAGGIPEIIDEGCSGRTFTSGDGADLERCLVEMRDTPLAHAGMHCAAMAERFSAGSIVESNAGFYEEVIQRYAAGRHA